MYIILNILLVGCESCESGLGLMLSSSLCINNWCLFKHIAYDSHSGNLVWHLACISQAAKASYIPVSCAKQLLSFSVVDVTEPNIRKTLAVQGLRRNSSSKYVMTCLRNFVFVNGIVFIMNQYVKIYLYKTSIKPKIVWSLNCIKTDKWIR